MTKRCLNCGSAALDDVNAELSFARGKVVPVYTLGKMAVCLACGFAEYLVSEEPLALLRQGVSARLEESRLAQAPQKSSSD